MQDRHSPRYCYRERTRHGSCQPLGNWEGAASRSIRKSGHPHSWDFGVKTRPIAPSLRVTWGDSMHGRRDSGRRKSGPGDPGARRHGLVAAALLLAGAGQIASGAPDRLPGPTGPIAPPAPGPSGASSGAPDSAPPAPSPPAAPSVGAETIVIVEGTAQSAAAPQRQRALGAAPFVTIVEAADRRGELLSVAEAISATVGTSVRSAGGVGAGSLLSIRGASSGHTSVLVDGIPLSRLTSASVDLGRFRLDELDAVEIYRGNVPAELGAAGVGGAVNLVTRLGPGREGEAMRATVGAGSYGARRLGAHYGDTWRGTDVAASAGYLAAEGDYRVYSDAGTSLNLDDDSWQTRENNAARQLDASLRAGRAAATATGEATSTTGGVRFAWQRHGLPGLIAAPAMHASLSTVFAMADGELRRPIAGWDSRHRGFATAEWQRFRDRDDEIGLGAEDRAYLTLGAGASTTWKRTFAEHQLQLGAEGRLERFRDRDRLGAGATSSGSRQTVGVTLGDELAQGEWLVAAVLRLELSRTAPAMLPDGLAEPLPVRYEVLPSPRLTGRVLAERDVAVKASAGWYSRQPTLIELFGDRGFIVGTPELKAETGPSFDLGVVWAPAAATGPVDRTLVEVSGFFNYARDAILFVNTGFVARPRNAGAAQNVGLELAGTTRLWRALQLTANYTLQLSEQLEDEPSYDGQDLPRHPRHDAYGRLEAHARTFGRQLRGYGELHWISQSSLDRAGLQTVPARLLVGTGASVELVPRLELSLEIKNLLDRQVEELPLEPPPRPDFTSTPVAIADLSGLPLPGRHLFVSLEWSR